jgi:D-alanyl-D-alanine dipeptidase
MCCDLGLPSVLDMTTLIADPRVADRPVHDNDEPLVDLATRGIACANLSLAPRNGRLARAGVADRLAAADVALPPGIRLLVLEGFRTAESQRQIMTWYSGQLRAANPGFSDEDIRRLASRYVAPIDVAPHVAGAAVDVTLVDRDRIELDMGTPVDATPEESGNACAFDAAISAQARQNRELLASVLSGVGLVNYPTEWWHWSYGDRYWAHLTGAACACYGPVQPELLTAALVWVRP